MYDGYVNDACVKFTFHYVSIKSKQNIIPCHVFTSFTFHYVSIKSGSALVIGFSLWSNLHSTMYLLNPDCCCTTQRAIEFTFHYVSIKSRIATPYHFSSLFSVFLSTYHHTMLNHMYTSPAFFILRINTRLSMSL